MTQVGRSPDLRVSPQQKVRLKSFSAVDIQFALAPYWRFCSSGSFVHLVYFLHRIFFPKAVAADNSSIPLYYFYKYFLLQSFPRSKGVCTCDSLILKFSGLLMIILIINSNLRFASQWCTLRAGEKEIGCVARTRGGSSSHALHYVRWLARSRRLANQQKWVCCPTLP